MNLRLKNKVNDLNLGDLVNDRISGFKGIITSITDFVAGCRRVGVISNTLQSDGLPTEAQHFDEQNLVIIKKNEIEININYPKINIKLGDRVKHKIHGFKGIVTSITNYLSDSNPVIAITPETLHDGKPIDSAGFPFTMISKIEEQVHVEPGLKRTGGNQRIPRLRK